MNENSDEERSIFAVKWLLKDFDIYLDMFKRIFIN